MEAREPAASSTPSRTPLLLYDGECGLCARSVQWVLEHDRVKAIRFAPLQGETAAPILARHGLAPDPQAGWGSLVLVDDPGGPRERVLQRSSAALAVGRSMGGPWPSMARFAGLVPGTLRDAVYDVIARNRIRWFGKAPDACRIPRRDERPRMLP
jgi:predicted DCC family thiol-disulfide oxidoreductase YuxK